MSAGSFNYAPTGAVSYAPLVTIDFAAPTRVGWVDVFGAKTLTAGKAMKIYLQTKISGGVFATVAGFEAYDTARNQTLSPPPGSEKEIVSLRLVMIGQGGLQVDDVFVGAAADDYCDVRFRAFTVEDQIAYMLAMGDRATDIWRNGDLVATLPTKWVQSQLARLDTTQRLDTMLAFHENVAPQRIFRDGADSAWTVGDLALTNIPNAQFSGATYVNGANERQQIEFREFTAGDTFNLSFEGQTTSSIAYATSGLGPIIKTALEALDALETGDVLVTELSTTKFTVTFQGNAAQTNWPEMAASVVNSDNGIVTTATLDEGKEGGEPIISDARGWPRTGKFHSGRLVMAGLRDLPDTGLASRFGDYFDFSDGSNRATDGFEFTVDSADGSGIRRLAASRYLQLFTGTSENYIAADTLSGEAANPIVQASQFGLQPNVVPVQFDGATVYVELGGQIVRELVFSDEARNFISTDISVRANFLIDQPVDATARKAALSFSTGCYFLVNMTGQVATFTSLRSQGVSAWARDLTDGKILAAGADGLGRVYFHVERMIDGAAVRSIESYEPYRYLDASILVELDNDITVGGLGHLEGKSILIAGGGEWFGPLEVSGGAVTLPQALTGTYEVGLWFDAWVELLDVRGDTREGSLMNQRKRVMGVTASLLESTPPEVEYLGRTYKMVPEGHAGTILGDGPMSVLVTGHAKAVGLKGWTRDTAPKIKRWMPGPYRIRALSMEVLV